MAQPLSKISILEPLCWDSSVSAETLLPLVDGTENCAKLYTEKVRRGLRNGDFRQKYDFAFGILRGEPVQAPRWGSEYCEKLRHTFVSDRWNH